MNSALLRPSTVRVVDLFAGGGGASQGISLAFGRGPDVAINHDECAIAMHAANHPDTEHYRASVYDVSPLSVCGLTRPRLIHASPDCTHFSRAKGSRPKEKEIRDLAWVVLDWVEDVGPDVVTLENVPEFVSWGPLDGEGNVVTERKGETFRAFVEGFKAEGYSVDWKTLVASDYGAPTKRKRLFLVARRDRQPIVWPEPTHGPGLLPYRTTAECLDWSIECPSIFTRKKPLAPATQRRIAAGIKRFVLDREPYVVSLPDGSVVSPWLVNTRNGERPGQAPRVRDVREPYLTITAKGSQGAVAAVWLARHFGQSTGTSVEAPCPTITAGGGGKTSLCAAFLTKFYGTATGISIEEPCPTITSSGQHLGLVVVRLGGIPYYISDIGMRMLQPRELARCQGFDDDYVLTGTKTQQIAKIGNSVPPQVVAALVRAQFPRGLEA